MYCSQNEKAAWSVKGGVIWGRMFETKPKVYNVDLDLSCKQDGLYGDLPTSLRHGYTCIQGWKTVSQTIES